MTTKRLIYLLPGLLLLAGLIVWLAPPEKTMGYGIRPVYVHVALIWTGMLGLLAVGALGLWLGVRGQESVWAWLDSVGWVTLGFLIASFAASAVAQIVNWNGIFLDEPRMQAMIRVMIAFFLLHLAQRWLPAIRWRGWLLAVASPVLLFTLRATPLVLHPNDPITVADSWPIQMTFLILFLVCLVAAIVFVIAFRSRLDRVSISVA